MTCDEVVGCASHENEDSISIEGDRVMADQTLNNGNTEPAVPLRRIVLSDASASVGTLTNGDSSPAIATNVHILDKMRIAFEENASVAHSLNRAIADRDVELKATGEDVGRANAEATLDVWVTHGVCAGISPSATIGGPEDREAIEIECHVVGGDHDCVGIRVRHRQI